MPVFVGCDLGTMGTKAAVADGDGTLLGDAFEEVPLRSPRPGWVEQDLEEIEGSAHRTIRAALAASGRAGDVAGVAFSGQMSGIGAVDERLRPAVRFDSWLDTRCEPYIAAMNEHADRVTELSGCPPTYSHGPKILWWRKERPQDYRRVARFVVPGAFVAGRLCGLEAEEAFVDRTYLHFSNLADTRRAAWSWPPRTAATPWSRSAAAPSPTCPAAGPTAASTSATSRWCSSPPTSATPATTTRRWSAPASRSWSWPASTAPRSSPTPGTGGSDAGVRRLRPRHHGDQG
ncbi:MAG TPA: FGGY family carbohydrate kinase, partial [Actinomycetes bacterium]|nr:FGGY family carbohydrate kinase [Actinomycetes bacterium]